MFMTVWSMPEECAGQLGEPFRRSEILGWFRRHQPEVNEATLAAHIQAATINAANRARNNPLGTGAPLLRRLITPCMSGHPRCPDQPAPVAVPARRSQLAEPGGEAADVILIGCVRTKRATACAAAELFTSPLFAGRLRYAAGTGAPWYILSAKFGLLAPGDVIGPYDLYLGDQGQAYRRALGEFAVAPQEGTCSS